MLKDYNTDLKEARIPVRKRLKKTGTIKFNTVETTPVVWKDKLIRFFHRYSLGDKLSKYQCEVGKYQGYKYNGDGVKCLYRERKFPTRLENERDYLI